jgi:selenocysteine-specific translation elongation factor
MSQGVFVPQNIFKVAGKGLVISGFFKKGILKTETEVGIKK